MSDSSDPPITCIGGEHCICDDCMHFLIKLADEGRSINRIEDE